MSSVVFSREGVTLIYILKISSSFRNLDIEYINCYTNDVELYALANTKYKKICFINQNTIMYMLPKDMKETFFENTSSPHFLRYNIKMLYDMPLGKFKEQIKNNFVDLYVPSEIATSSALSNLINKVQKIGRRIEPNIYQEDNFIDKALYDLDEIDEVNN